MNAINHKLFLSFNLGRSFLTIGIVANSWTVYIMLSTRSQMIIFYLEEMNDSQSHRELGVFKCDALKEFHSFSSFKQYINRWIITFYIKEIKIVQVYWGMTEILTVFVPGSESLPIKVVNITSHVFLEHSNVTWMLLSETWLNISTLRKGRIVWTSLGCDDKLEKYCLCFKFTVQSKTIQLLHFSKNGSYIRYDFNVWCTEAGITICLQTHLIFHIPAVPIRFVERVCTELVTISLLLHLALYLILFQFTNWPQEISMLLLLLETPLQ